jgi:glycosyltransferase involved in cell wall biosynthesis
MTGRPSGPRATAPDPTAGTGAVAAEPAGGGPVAQRLVLVLPTTAEFDSRTFRIASSMVARGHEVTVLARWKAGLPREERHAAGYRIIRVPVSAAAGVPLLGRFRRPPRERASAPLTESSGRRDQEGSAAARHATRSPASPGGRSGISSLPRRLAGSIIRRFSIPLTIRAQRLATIPVAPAADLYHGMAYMGVSIALDLAARHGGRAVYDARDIYVDAANLARAPAWIRWSVGRSERRWARRADRVVTVNRPYAEVMAERWALPLPAIVMNCAYRFEPPSPREHRFHDRLGLDPERRVVVYHGGFSRDRGIEQLIDAITDVPDATLVLMGYGQLEAWLRAIVDEQARDDIRVMPAVPPTELLTWLASADVIAMPIQPTTLNHRLTTPNKLFEAMAAGVPVVASDLPGMASIVRETACGQLVDPTDPTAIAAAIRDILARPPDELAAWRDRCSHAARTSYDWESQLAVLIETYGRITGSAW